MLYNSEMILKKEFRLVPCQKQQRIEAGPAILAMCHRFIGSSKTLSIQRIGDIDVLKNLI